MVVEAYDGHKLIASKFVSVVGGSFCVVPLNPTLESAGDHTITVSDMSAVITVESSSGHGRVIRNAPAMPVLTERFRNEVFCMDNMQRLVDMRHEINKDIDFVG
jgi:hypothetical protein